MELTMTGRERLAAWIERSKINQLEASAIIGIDPTQLSKIMTGERTPGLANAIKIERATGIQPEAWAPSTDDEVASDRGASAGKRRIAKA